MKLELTHDIYYSVQLDFCDGRSILRDFRNTRPLKSRSAALTFYLEKACLTDDYTSDELIGRVFLNNAQTYERIELTNSEAFHSGQRDFSGLQQEFELYKKFQLKTAGVAIFNEKQPHLVTLLSIDHKTFEDLKTPTNYFLIQDDYWVFLRKKKRNTINM